MRPFWLVLALLAGAWAQESYLPAREGLSWTYANGETQSYSARREFQGHDVLVLTHVLEGFLVSEDYLSVSSEGAFLHASAAGGEVIVFEPPLLIFPSGELEPGQRWQSQARAGAFEISLLAEVVAVRGVETPAGRFNALLIEQRTVTSSGAQTRLELFFVPGVGVVRTVLPDGSVVDLIDKNF